MTGNEIEILSLGVIESIILIVFFVMNRGNSSNMISTLLILIIQD